MVFGGLCYMAAVLIGCAVVGVPVAVTIALIILRNRKGDTPERRQELKQRRFYIVPAAALALALGLLSGGGTQSLFQERDAAIKSAFDKSPISLVGYQGFTDGAAIVKRGSCTAAYSLRAGADIGKGAWPLKAGTGHVGNGCPAGITSLDLDRLFLTR